MYMNSYTYSCNRLPLIKSCLCCFLDMHLYSNNFSAIENFVYQVFLVIELLVRYFLTKLALLIYLGLLYYLPQTIFKRFENIVWFCF